MDSALIKNSSFINGLWVGGHERLEVKNPATGEKIAAVKICDENTVTLAINSATEAFASWTKALPGERSALLRKLSDLLTLKSRELAEILTLEQGKPFEEALAEIRYGAAYVEWYAEEAKRLYGYTLPSIHSKKQVLVQREPIGVCAAITPWNFPMAMIARKMAPALAAGCSFIVKPATETPLSALALAACVEQCGFPPGVFNVVCGDARAISKVLMESETVRKISFTGSTEVGKILLAQSAETVKKMTLELGGNAPFLLFDDACLESAVSAAVVGKFRNAGQSCVGINRFLIEESVTDRFCSALATRSAALKVGNGMDPTVDIGPLINKAAKDKVARLVNDALKKGAVLVSGELDQSATFFCKPCVLRGVSSDMQISKEEIFGPVCAIQTFRDEAEAIDLANNTEYGLAAYIFTKDLDRSRRISSKLQYGMVGINTGLLSLPEAPFGGLKHSGFGREGGKEGIEEYLTLKYICIES